jgi:hypothetical protein
VIAIAVSAWSPIGAGGSASGATVHGIAAMPLWLICQNSHNRMGIHREVDASPSCRFDFHNASEQKRQEYVLTPE